MVGYIFLQFGLGYKILLLLLKQRLKDMKSDLLI